MSSPDPAQWAGSRGRVTTLVETRVTSGQAATGEAYLCGSRAMIDDVGAVLRGKGMPAERTHFENSC